MKITAGDYSNLSGAKVVVITAGVSQKPGETRLDLLAKNASVFRSIIPQVVKYNPNGIILITTNPVDILTYISLKEANLPPAKGFRIGGLFWILHDFVICSDSITGSIHEVCMHIS